ncbi:MAG: HesA/MoeB/ThiF family protein [Rhodoferax sp.]|nr:HesA/MoeB/ThiF family protein [Pseudorhodobacter sp.]
MIVVLALAAGLWGFGALFGASRQARLGMIFGLWAGVIGLHLGLPEGHPLRMATGQDARIWLILGGLAALGGLYFAGIGRLKRRFAAVVPVPTVAVFRPAELDRYARHIMLREIGGPGQGKLKAARVLVIGAGGLGSPALLYLAAAGVGTIGVIDDDVVEGSNLQRQIIHADQRIGMAKVQSAAVAMTALNPFITVRPYQRRLTEDIAPALIGDYDLVLDGSDNFDTRYLVNRVCVALGKPLISGAITQWEGQLSLFDPAHGSPCYECIFPVRPAPGMVPTCAEAGVAAPLPGVIGAMMAMEAVKHITGAGETLRGRLMIHDALFMETRVIGVKRRFDCAVCGVSH